VHEFATKLEGVLAFEVRPAGRFLILIFLRVSRAR